MKKNIKNKACPAKLQRSRGFMMVEVLIATSIILVSVLAAMSVAQKSIYVSRQALHTSQAAFLLEEGAENTRISRDNTWSNLTSLNASENIGIFTRTTVASNVCRNNSNDNISSSVSCGGTTYLDNGTKLIIVNVSWPEGGAIITKTLQFYIMDIFS